MLLHEGYAQQAGEFGQGEGVAKEKFLTFGGWFVFDCEHEICMASGKERVRVEDVKTSEMQ